MSDVKIQSCYTTYMSKSITKWRTKITYEYLTKSSPYDSALLYVHQQFIHICKCLKLNVFLLQHQCFTDSIKHRWCKVMAPLKKFTCISKDKSHLRIFKCLQEDYQNQLTRPKYRMRHAENCYRKYGRKKHHCSNNMLDMLLSEGPVLNKSKTF